MSTPPDRKLATVLDAFKRSWNRGESESIADFCDRHAEFGPELRASIEAFIARSEGLTATRDTPTRTNEPTPIPSTPWPDHPAWIGPYRVLGPLGEGGMGTVYLAEQTEPVRREVAIKLIRFGLDSANILRRFETERQALALMNHPAIAKVYDAGVADRGQPYFVMEVVEGIPLTEFCDLYKLSPKQRIQVFQQICAGVEHAHQKSVLHRDLKPANILVSLSGGQIVVKIIDFGLARATDRSTLARTAHTQDGRVVGTPEYMSPEQARGEVRAIDNASDIYTLGVILYQLLTGELPYRRPRLDRCGPVEILRTIQEEIPQRPSSRILSIGKRGSVHARNRRSSRSGLRKTLQGELDWIVMKALAKDPERRYQSVMELSNDLGNFLHDEPVGAGPDSAGYRLSRLTRRYREQLLAGVLILAIATFGGFSIWSFVEAKSTVRNEETWKEQARTQEQRAKEQADRADAAQADTRAIYSGLTIATMLAQSEARMAALCHSWPQDITALEGALTEIDGWGRDLEQLRRGHPNSLVGQSFTKLARRIATRRLAIGRQLTWAREIAGLTIEHPGAQATWRRARMAITAADGITASRLYAQDPIDLTPQLGLLPIGRHPRTGLWEFYHLRSAWDPRIGADPNSIRMPRGGRDVGERDGIVFVLIPGDGRGRRPFFLAQHELTQGQWARLTGGDNPSAFGPGCVMHTGGAPIDLRHPVESVSWSACRDLLEQFGLRLPSRSEWDHACDGDPGAAFDPSMFLLATRGLHAMTAHSPAGSSPANAFGLHDMLDNVAEWCSDEIEFGSVLHRAVRGADFRNPHVATWRRAPAGVGARSETRGLRAARAVER